MKNTHIEHPEDSILTGDLSVLDWFCADGNISVKIDGAPAIVWGRNPATGNQFVGTKSVFNKKLIKINESHEDIDKNHSGNVANILHECWDYLPETDNIYQGDFIGFGGDNCYRPNTITYVFDEIVPHEIIIAPHTVYSADNDLRDAIARPISDREILSLWNEDCDVLFVRPFVTLKEHRDDMNDLCNFAAQMSTLCTFVNERQATHLKKVLNSYIRDGRQVDEEEIALQHDVDINLIRLWKLVESIKMDMFCYIETDDSMKCIIEGHEVDHEGYVMENGFGTFKLVDRETFSYHNFNLAKCWN